jgi:hypothetical protein
MSKYIGNIPASLTRSTFTATAGQTTFSTSGYTVNFIDVYLNGVKLINNDDFTATDGVNVVLTSGAALNDVVEVVAYTTFSIAGGFVPTTGGTFTGDVAISSTGAFTVPVGTTAQRPTPIKGMFRFNDSDDVFEGYNGTEWGAVGGGGGFFRGENGAVGDPTTGPGDIFRINEQELNTSTTIGATENASCTGPLAIASGVTLTVTSGGSLAIL